MVSAPDLHSGGLQVQVLYRPPFINMHILERTNRFRRIERRFNSPINGLLYQMHWLEDMKHRDIALMLNMPRATVTKWFNRLKIPKRFVRHFIRGYFDGDGSICYNYYPESTNPNIKFMHQQVVFAAANKNFVKALESKLSEVAKVSHPCFKSAKDSNCHYLSYAKQSEILKLINFMYNNVNSSLYLDRKYGKFINWKLLIGDVA